VGWFSSAVHSISNAVDQVVKPASSLFDSKSALVRALANPGDPIAVGQVFDNTAVKRQTPQDQVRDANASTVQPTVDKFGDYHQQLWYHIEDGASWLYHGVIDLWHSIWYNIRNLWRQTGFRNHFDKLGDNIHSVVQKWGGERRVVAWVVVVVVVVIYIIWLIVTWGTGATLSAGWYALIMAILSWGLQQGLTPDAPDPQSAQSLSLFNDNHYNPISNSNSSSSSGQEGSFLDQLANALGNLPPAVLIGAAALGTVGVYYLLSRR
jgi:hypothetical protein